MPTSTSLELFREVVAEAQRIAPDVDRGPLIAAVTRYANQREAAMAVFGVKRVGEIIIAPKHPFLPEGFTVVQWDADQGCPPLGSAIYAIEPPATFPE